MPGPQSLILKNAISSLRLGLEDYIASETDPDRRLSSIRNIYASLLLFLKEGLLRYSPNDSKEVLLKASIIPFRNPDGEIRFIGYGQNTVNVHDIQKRYRHLGIQINWEPLDKIRKERNNVEHYYSTTKIELVQSVICDASTFIIEILKKVLDIDPISMLGPIWKQMTAIADIYALMKRRCNETLEVLKNYHLMSDRAVSLIQEFSCPDFNSKLYYLFTGTDEPSDNITIKISDLAKCNLVCYACHSNINIVEAFEDYADEMYELSLKDFRGGYSPIVQECPNCGNRTFIDSYNMNYCIFCDGRKEYEYCNICERFLTMEEQEFEGLCMDCDYNYQVAISED